MAETEIRIDYDEVWRKLENGEMELVSRTKVEREVPIKETEEQN